VFVVTEGRARLRLVRVGRPVDGRVEVRLDESRAAWVALGATVPVVVDGAGPEAEQPGRVREISRAIDADTRAMRVTISLRDPGTLWPGMFARVRLPGPSSRVLTVPDAALVHRGQLTSVFVVTEGRARLRLVRVGRPVDGRVEVLAGLSDAERVVVDPPADLRDGARVSEDSGSPRQEAP
jgi:RND family efflux transporter MFP subunit